MSMEMQNQAPAGPPPEARPFWKPKAGEILNIAHRGGSSLGPENTLAAAAKAMACGAHFWELDVQLTADDQLVVMHDYCLTRTSNARHKMPHLGPWQVCSLSLSDIQQCDCGSWFVQNDPYDQVGKGCISQNEACGFSGLKAPTLREALTFTRDMHWPVNVEIKDLRKSPGHQRVVKLVLDMIEELGMTDLVLISSFNHDYLRQARALNPDIALGVLVRFPPSDPVGMVRSIGAQTCHVDFKALRPEHIACLKEAGIPVLVYSVNRQEDMNRCIAAGVDGIFTDFPQVLDGLALSACFRPNLV